MLVDLGYLLPELHTSDVVDFSGSRANTRTPLTLNPKPLTRKGANRQQNSRPEGLEELQQPGDGHHPGHCPRFRVQGLGFGVEGLGFRVQGWGLGFRVWGLGFCF